MTGGVLGRPEILERVRKEFIELAQKHHETSKPAAKMHAQMLERSRLPALDFTKTCAFCFIEPPRYALVCNHRLCRPCTMILGREQDPWSFRVTHCPLCLTLNSTIFIINPPTAGLRLLRLAGHDEFNTWLFLKSLQKALGINGLHLSDYFDGVVASDSGLSLGLYHSAQLIDLAGVFLTITTFVEGWSLSDSRFHLKRIKQPKFPGQDRVTFGKGLEWDLGDDRFFRNTDIILEGKKNHWSNLQPYRREDKR